MIARLLETFLKGHLKQLLIFAIICLLNVTATGHLEAGQDDWKVHTSTALGLQLKYPAEWRMRETPGKPSLSIAFQEKPGQNTFLTIYVVENDPHTDALLKQDDSWTLSKDGRRFAMTRVAGEKALVIDRTLTSDTVKTVSYTLKRGQRFLVIALMASNQIFWGKIPTHLATNDRQPYLVMKYNPITYGAAFNILRAMMLGLAAIHFAASCHASDLNSESNNPFLLARNNQVDFIYYLRIPLSSEQVGWLTQIVSSLYDSGKGYSIRRCQPGETSDLELRCPLKPSFPEAPSWNTLQENQNFKRWAGDEILQLLNEMPVADESEKLAAGQFSNRHERIHHILENRFGLRVKPILKFEPEPVKI